MATAENDFRITGIDDSRKPIIAGAAMIPFQRYQDGSTFRDWIRIVGGEAISDAQLEPSEVGSVVVGSESDMLSLQVSPAALVVDELGLQGAAAVHVEAGGATGAAALREGFVQICSGVTDNVLVVGFDQTASRLSRSGVQKVYSLSFDADIEGWMGVSTANLYALSFKMYCDRFDANSRQAALVSVKNHGNATKNRFAHKPMKITTQDVFIPPWSATLTVFWTVLWSATEQPQSYCRETLTEQTKIVSYGYQDQAAAVIMYDWETDRSPIDLWQNSELQSKPIRWLELRIRKKKLISRKSTMLLAERNFRVLTLLDFAKKDRLALRWKMENLRLEGDCQLIYPAA